jgi:hypothetical protein
VSELDSTLLSAPEEREEVRPTRATSPPKMPLPRGFPVNLLYDYGPGMELEQLRVAQKYCRYWLRELGERCPLPSTWDGKPYEVITGPWPDSEEDDQVIRLPLERASAVKVDWKLEETCSVEMIRRRNGVPFTMYELYNSTRKSLTDYMRAIRMPKLLTNIFLSCWVNEHQRNRTAINYNRSRQCYCPVCKFQFYWPPKGAEGWSKKPGAIIPGVKLPTIASTAKIVQKVSKRVAAAAAAKPEGIAVVPVSAENDATTTVIEMAPTDDVQIM